MTTVSFSSSSGIGTIALDRPEAGNAVSLELARDLHDAVITAEADRSVKVVVVRGAGRNFCVGGDLKAFAAQRDLPSHLREVTTHLHAAIIALARMDAPIVVGVQGSAAGAGLGLAAGGDFVIATESARFVVAYTKIGLNPDGGTSFLLPRLVGLRRAQELTLLNEPLGAKDALDIGLVTRVVADDALDDEIAAVATRLAAGPGRAQGEAKRLLRSSLDESLALHLEAEAAAIVRSAERPDAREGISAFLEKRPPSYQ
ncbi:MAG TPA: enoyl-CoA hydratase-related protein [Acidimicrobiales bacterium]|nr:enoyl-CoA hydratase-related protein [Acidimicrobiales bacterium]